MEEADILADQIIIMKEGNIICNGSPYELKTKYGEGYHVTLFKEPYANTENVVKFVKDSLPTAEIIGFAYAEISFRVPFADSNLNQFFEEIDKNKEKIGIKSYIVSLTTLEEVFIKVSQQTNENQENQETADSDLLPQKFEKKDFFNDFRALIKKRFQITRRDYYFFCIEFVVPIFIVLVGTYLMLITDLILDQSSYKELISKYQLPQDIIYYAKNDVVEDLMTSLQADNDITITPSTANTTYYFDLEVFDSRNYFPYRMGSLFFYEMDNDIYEPVIFHNQTAFQSLSTYYQAVSLAILHTYDPSIQITVYNHPLPVTEFMKNVDSIGDAIISSLVFGLAFSFIPAGILFYIVKEEVAGIKFQHLISGCSLTWY